MMQRHKKTNLYHLPVQQDSPLKVSAIVLLHMSDIHTVSPLDPLNVQCRKESFHKISNAIRDWKSVGTSLLGFESFQKIDQELLSALESDQDRMIKILHTWHERKGAEATYRVLVKLLESTSNHDAANALRAFAMAESDMLGKYCIE